MNGLSDFTNLYPVSKTLRFELIPQGKTLENIENKELIKQDEHRAESYIKVKKIIDDYHKQFIENALKGFRLECLGEYLELFRLTQKDDAQKKKFGIIQDQLRKHIADRFKNHPDYKHLFLKDLIKDRLKSFVQNDADKAAVAEFDKFTTYFTGFHENRENMYSSENKATAIACRLIHDNLPKFINNMKAFEKIKRSDIEKKFDSILSDFKTIIQVHMIDEVFTLEYFNETLTQQGIDKYNQLIGGYTAEDGVVKIKGLNEYINQHNQTASKEARLPRFQQLYKQILTDRTSASFIPEQFNDDNEVLESIERVYREINEHVLNKNVNGEYSLKKLLQNITEFDLSGIFLRNDAGLTEISQKMFGDWGTVKKCIGNLYDRNYTGKKKPGTGSYEIEKERYLKNQVSFSIESINRSISLLENEDTGKRVEKYFEKIGETNNDKGITSHDFFARIETSYTMVRDLLNNSYPEDKNLALDQANVDKIKTLLDSIKDLQRFIKPLLGNGDEPERDSRFYGEFTALWATLDQVTVLYNKVRNYMTKKPYSTEKIKLNFENATLLAGWDVNKEPDNTGTILRKDGKFYLGIMNKKHGKIFQKEFSDTGTGCFEKMEYKLLPGANKMLPKVFFSDARIGEFKPNPELLENYKKETHKKGDMFNIQHCRQLIDFFKESINNHPDWKKFKFSFSKTETYEDLSGFYREVEHQGYKISFTRIPEEYVIQQVNEGKLYLFQIYNKDFSPHSKGAPNMHTLYWKMLFDPENLKNVVYKLNGQAEVFFRKSSIKHHDQIVHKANMPIVNKNAFNGKKQSTFDYDIIKDRRYTTNKFQFHVPITMNFKAHGPDIVNNACCQFLKASNDVHIIGIDRGERHLLYIVLIDLKGKIIRQFSLNEILNDCNGVTFKTDYHELLDKKEGTRDNARKNWKTIESIKELKEGYLSQVIHKIAQLMIEYNAVVALEDLNIAFMRGRQKVEKQVYQKFEKMLIDKLNYLVDKQKNANDTGGLLNAYQLTNKFESFQKMGKQSGFLFYVPAWYTSKTDPITGFINLFDTHYENIAQAARFFGKFESIRNNPSKRYYEFEVKKYSNFNPKAEGTRQDWTICTYGDRIETFRNKQKNNQWDSRIIVLTDAFMEFFGKHGIPAEGEIKEAIMAQTEKSFFQSLFYLFKLTLQMRNSMPGTDTDYLISPVADENGLFFDSRKAGEAMPKNADANGAYNIARKGALLVERIKNAEGSGKLNLAVSNKEWLNFIQ